MTVIPTTHCDVAVVGLGPTGAVLANLLGQRGHSVICLERDEDIYYAPKAVHFDDEAMRVFQDAGLADEIGRCAEAFEDMELLLHPMVADAQEVLDTLNNFVREGKVRYIACSNFSGWHLMKSLAVSDRFGWARYVAHQVYYSLVGREYEWELMPLGLDQKVGALVWSPLGWGRLTGKLRRGQPLPETSRLHKTAAYGPQVEDEHLYNVVDALDMVAAETGKTVPQVALNWLLQRPTVSSVIFGARTEEQLRQNLAAVGWNLTAEQVAALDKASQQSPVYPYWHQRQFTERNPLPV